MWVSSVGIVIVTYHGNPRDQEQEGQVWIGCLLMTKVSLDYPVQKRILKKMGLLFNKAMIELKIVNGMCFN